LITAILYYLQADGLIYVTLIAVVAELFNIFMTHTLSKSVEKRTKDKFIRIIADYRNKIAILKKKIKEFEDVQEKYIQKLNAANLKIKEYEARINEASGDNTSTGPDKAQDEPDMAQPAETHESESSDPQEFVDLPSGSNRKRLPI
jgi:predicted ribosome quality control (RQC) complex YloA/Tae2 family protein